MNMKQKRCIISALSGGGGKTLTTLALARALTSLGHEILPFKKGPDYIDATWLSLAARKKCYNLDPFFLDKDQLLQHFVNICTRNAKGSIALIEGNRGLYDGKDVLGSASTAELAVSISSPVILTMDAKKATRTLAALVNGMVDFDKRIDIIGLIINNVASKRHEDTISQAINHYCKVPILGCIPRFEENPFPERHLGLVFEENEQSEEILNNLSKIARENIDIASLLEKLDNSPALEVQTECIEISEIKAQKTLKIGYIKDKSLWFYYSENLEMLENSLSLKGEGVELIPLSLFEESSLWDEIDALYIGGGYPEVYADEIEKSPILAKIKERAENNLPIYAECGGFMLLCSSITKAYSDEKYMMANIFDIDLEFHAKPQGLGYIEANVVGQNPYFPCGTKIKGHEFHYSIAQNAPKETIFALDKGTGMGNKQDGLVYKQVFASYTHIYALSEPQWAKSFVELASKYRENRDG